MFNSKQKKKRALHFELIPMIDVMMILVLFLAVMAFLPSVQGAISVDLTKSNTKEKVKDTDIVLTVEPGKFMLKGQSIAGDQLVPALKKVTEGLTAPRIVIAASRELSFDTVVAILDMVRGGGFKNVALATEFSSEK